MIRGKIDNRKPDLMEECMKEGGYQEHFTQDERPIQLSFHPRNPQNITRINSSNCTSYDKCLDYAIAKKWASYTCEKCPKFLALRIVDQRLKLG